MNPSRILDLMATDFLAAERQADALLAQQPDSPAALQLKAYLLNFRKDYLGAAECLAAALERAPHDEQIAFNLAYCRLQSGDVRAARSGFAKLGSFDARLLAALCRRWLGEPHTFPAGTTPAARFFAGGEVSPENPADAAALVHWINRHDVPGWGRLDDKAALAELLARHRYAWSPETFTGGARPSEPGPWIAKHAKLYGGQAIHIAADAAALPAGPDWVVQRYLADPMLLDGRKFHMRLYLGLIGGKAFLFDDGIVRVAPADYGDDLADARRHITNTLRFAADGETRRATRVLALNELGLAAEIRERMRCLAQDLADIVRGERIALAHLACPLSAVPPKLLGLDVLPDAQGRPWLLEVERYPALHGGSPAADAVNAALFRWFCGRIAIPADSGATRR